MVVKIANKEFVKHIDCIGTTIVPDRQPPDEVQIPNLYTLVFYFKDKSDMTLTLSPGDKIWYLNNEGKTIDSDFRMCHLEKN